MPFQRGILQALQGRALRTDALAAEVGDRSRLFRPGGLAELRDRGLVDHHPRLGYYRPDALPPELTEAANERNGKAEMPVTSFGQEVRT